MVIFMRSIEYLGERRNYHNETDDFFMKITIMKIKSTK